MYIIWESERTDCDEWLHHIYPSLKGVDYDRQKIKLSGAYNFRDFGGYRNKEGKRLIRGRLYRSDELSKITAADQEKLVQLGISKIIDYRNKKERLNNEDRPIGNAEILYLTPIADIAALASSEHDEESALSPQKWRRLWQKN